MTFVVPASESRKPENRFHFESDGKKFSVPKLGFVNGEASGLLEQGLERAGSLAAFDDDDAREIYAALDRNQRDKFDAEWIKVSKVSPGESRGSAGSSESTAGQ